MVMDRVMNEIKQESQWFLMFADDTKFYWES